MTTHAAKPSQVSALNRAFDSFFTRHRVLPGASVSAALAANDLLRFGPLVMATAATVTNATPQVQSILFWGGAFTALSGAVRLHMLAKEEDPVRPPVSTAVPGITPGASLSGLWRTQ